jgi:hypothetical protein
VDVGFGGHCRFLQRKCTGKDLKVEIQQNKNSCSILCTAIQSHAPITCYNLYMSTNHTAQVIKIPQLKKPCQSRGEQCQSSYWLYLKL